MFQVLPFFSLDKAGRPPREDRRQLQMILDSDKNGVGTIDILHGQNLGEYMAKQKYRVDQTKGEYLRRLPIPNVDRLHQPTIPFGEDALAAVRQMAKDDARASDCSAIVDTTYSAKVATVLVWPESRIVWKDIEVPMGALRSPYGFLCCGFD